MSDLRNLATQVEALSGPDRTLDMAIEAAISGNRAHPYLEATNIDDDHPSGRPYASPEYTRSYDAVLTLIPADRWQWDAGELPTPWACVTERFGAWRDATGKGADKLLSLLAAVLRSQCLDERTPPGAA